MTHSAVPTIQIATLHAMKQRGEKIVCLTAYDASFARLFEASGVEVLLVGDSLGMVVQGHPHTLPVTLDDIVYHTRCVSRVCQRALVIADLPFLSYATPANAARSAARLLRDGGAQMVKLEGARPKLVQCLVENGVPVCGHLGVLPQFVHLSGYKVQGKDPETAQRIAEEAWALQQAGASLLILECVPAALAAMIRQNLTIPVIGIGAGADCDGQVLVSYDMLGLTPPPHPRFVRDFSDAGTVQEATDAYVRAVKQGTFPGPEHSY